MGHCDSHRFYSCRLSETDATAAPPFASTAVDADFLLAFRALAGAEAGAGASELEVDEDEERDVPRKCEAQGCDWGDIEIPGLLVRGTLSLIDSSTPCGARAELTDRDRSWRRAELERGFS